MVMIVGVIVAVLLADSGLGQSPQQSSAFCFEQNSQRDVLFKKPAEKGTISKDKTKENHNSLLNVLYKY